MSDVPAARPRRGLAIASLVLGLLSLPTLGLLFVGAMASVALGVAALVKARREPAEYGGSGMAVAGVLLAVASILVTPVVGIVAAIAIPSLLRARVTANETAAIADVRTFLAAEQAYRSRNGGAFDTPECLAAPAACLGGSAGPALLPAGFVATGTHKGYHRVFYPGSPPAALEPGMSPSSLASFAYLAMPAVPAKTGVRSFCGDATGRVCYLLGPPPKEMAPVCPPDCVGP